MNDLIVREALSKLQEALDLAKSYEVENGHLERELGAAIKHAQYVMSLLESELKRNERLEDALVALRGILSKSSGNMN